MVENEEKGGRRERKNEILRIFTKVFNKKQEEERSEQTKLKGGLT